MPIIKERIRNNNQDVYLKIDLGVRNRLSGYQQEIDNLTEETKEELVNPVVDYEVERFKHLPSNVSVLIFNFSNYNGTSTANTFANAGFNSSEIEDADDNMLNSFFIMDVYDTTDNNTQTKLFTTYNTLILDSETSGGVPIPKYYVRDTTINQFFYQYVPKWFLDTQTGSTVTVYSKFSFYNAKYGTISLFFNPNEAAMSTKRMYFKTYLYPDDMEWKFDNYSLNPTELSPENSYVGKVNDTFENFQNRQQNPPEGAFNPEDGTYEEGLDRRASRTSSTRTGGRTAGDRTTSTSTTPDPEELDTPTRPTRPSGGEDSELPSVL